jgi:two-component system KDP operon response regulator KdpE
MAIIMHKKILIVDDEPQIRKFLKKTLLVLGYDVKEAIDTSHADGLLKKYQPDLIILDLGLPGIDGQEWLQILRKKSNVPVLVLSARSETDEIVKALENGANDYVKKPFDMPELMARIKKSIATPMLAKPIDQPEKLYLFGNMIVSLAQRQVKINDELISLSKKEFSLLSIFIMNAGKLITQTQILKEVWGDHYDDEVQYLRVYIGQLRKKLDSCSKQPLITTESGVGYRFIAEN